MRKLIVKLLEKLGLIPYKVSEMNQPCYDKYGRFIGWYSRSVAVAVFVFCIDKAGKWYVLGAERGAEAADFRGYWNSVCGYLDYWETTKQAAVRELNEEVGLKIEEEDIDFIGYEDSPSANRQNVTIRFATFFNGKDPKDLKFSREGNEGEEVGDIRWIPIDRVEHYKWAFNHDMRISEIYKQYKDKYDDLKMAET